MVKNKKFLKITFFIGGLSGGGAERVICNLANYLCNNKYVVEIITMSDDSNTYELDSGIKRINLLNKTERSNKFYNFYIRQKRLKQYIKENQDVSCYIAMLPITVFMLMRLKKYTNSKMIFSERCDPNSYSLFRKLMMKYAAKKCDGLVVQTKEISEWYKNVKNKIVIPNAINKDISFPRRKYIEKKIVAVGRLSKQKNYPMLIKAFSIFNRKNPDYILEIYGRGKQEKMIRKLINKYKIQGKVYLKGYVEDISNRIADSTCFVMTSNYEGMSNALIEAMCIGIPCIVTDCDGGGARELVINKKNGILIKKNDVCALVKFLEKITQDNSFAESLSVEAKLLRDRLSYEKIYREWEQYVRQIVGLV